MNLLVTNTRNAQAYAIIRSLRPRARKIVATVYGPNWLAARLSHASLSRYVAARYRVPDPTADWRSGNIGPENTEREEEYIQAILHICDREAIDVIFPSWDPHVLIFAKNKKKFDSRGILVPIPSYDVTVRLMDKYAVIQDAQKKGIPCPKTYLPNHPDDLRVIARKLGFPLVIKPRFSSGSRGLEIVSNAADFASRIDAVRTTYGWPIVQEYIPGVIKSAMMLIDLEGKVKELFCERHHRSFRGHVTVEESIPPFPEAVRLSSLLAELGYQGPVFAQTKVDSRDDLAKLLEVNVRLSAGVWTEMEAGIDVPWLTLQMARGDKINAQSYRAGVIEIDVFADLLALGFFIFTKIFKGNGAGDQDGLPSLRDQVKAYKATYTARDKVLDPYFRHFLESPVVSLAYWAQLLQSTWRDRRNPVFNFDHESACHQHP
jgi:hypothetical protein